MTIQTELFGVGADGHMGKKLRDEGIKQVSDHNDTWMERAIELASHRVRLTSRPDFTGEDIRFACELAIGHPKHPNAWGALTKALVNRKVIVPTGEYRSPKDKTSHARRIQVYRKA